MCVSMTMLRSQELITVFDHAVHVEPLDSLDVKHLTVLGRPELGITFTKLRVWSLTDYVKCVFLDADTVVLQNIDELFARCVDLSVAHKLNEAYMIFLLDS